MVVRRLSKRGRGVEPNDAIAPRFGDNGANEPECGGRHAGTSTRRARLSAARDGCLADAISQFRKYRRLAEGALAQVGEADFFRTIDAESNSIALVVKHIAGNMRSRWTDFLTTDGEKGDRDRDAEFELLPADSREAILARWDDGWNRLFAALTPLTEGDLGREIRIRGEAHTVVQAVHRQLTHYAYHVGQIVFLARHFAGSSWKSLSIPRGKSKEIEVARDGETYRVP